MSRKVNGLVIEAVKLFKGRLKDVESGKAEFKKVTIIVDKDNKLYAQTNKQ